MSVTARGKAKPPISSHPAFPAIVALWFAALLGVGSIVLPVVLLEKLVAASGLAALLPAAQPPLGPTARILIACAFAALGVAAGLYVARRVAAAQAVELPRERVVGVSQEPALRPLSAREELGIENLDSAIPGNADAPASGGRRPLSLNTEDGRSDFFDSAPLPRRDPYEPAADARDPLDLGDFAESEYVDEDASETAPDTPDQRQVFAADAGHVSELDAEADSAADSGIAENQPEPEMPMSETHPFNPFAAYAAAEPAPPRPFDAAPPQPEVHEDPRPEPAHEPSLEAASDRPLRELGMAELVERFALSLQRRAAAAAAAAAAPEEPLPLPQLKAERPDTQPVPAPLNPFAASHPEDADELAEALEPTAFTPAFEAAAPPAPAVPAALRPISFDEDEDEDEADGSDSDLSFSLDPQVRPFAQPAAENENDSETGDEHESDGYSSLLAMKSPLGAAREFVRIEDDADAADNFEPVAVVPGQQQQRRAAPASDGPSRDPSSQPRGPQAGLRPFDGPTHAELAAQPAPTERAERRTDPAQTERALRDALEKLQRLSGAA